MNYIGQKFNFLTLEAFAYKDKNSKQFYICKCDCGTVKNICLGDLKSNRTKSCGCLRVATLQQRALPYGVSSSKHLFNRYIRAATKRNLEWQLKYDMFLIITSDNCHYCGVKPSQTYRANANFGNGNYIYNGIDRIDNKKGYFINNCVSCCWICNRAKLDLSYNEFIEYIERFKSKC